MEDNLHLSSSLLICNVVKPEYQVQGIAVEIDWDRGTCILMSGKETARWELGGKSKFTWENNYKTW